MNTFGQIIQLRNSGKTQDEIASSLDISRRSVIRYLKDGKIPVYSRNTKSNRSDPLEGFYPQIRSALAANPKIQLSDLFEHIRSLGYIGSERTLRRKTRDLRHQLKHKEVFFQREAIPGEIMEGDFTELFVEIAGEMRKVYLWVSSLPYSNCYFASAYFNCTFECFADATVKAFSEFKGVPKKYRLDNMSPAVKKILMGKDRIVTSRFAELQNHYGFSQDFCNPSKGNEKGNVESNNRVLKNTVASRISITNQKFMSLKAFEDFVVQICREKSLPNQEKFSHEKLSPLPPTVFNCFRTEIVSISKYSLFGLGKSGHLYSVPSKYVGLSLESRIYPDRVEVIKDGEIICTHTRLYGPRGMVSIRPEHIISALIKKPGAMASWKYRSILFERPAWKSFYDQLLREGGRDKDYLKCLELITDYGREVVTVAMELALEAKIKLNNKELKKIITNELDNIHEIKPIQTNLKQYDFFLEGGNDGNKFKGET